MSGGKYILILCFLVLQSIACADASEKCAVVDYLLNTKDPRFYENGVYNELKEVYAWQQYLMEQGRKSESDQASVDDLKMFLTIGWFAELKNAALTSEYMTSKLYPVYVKHPTKVSKILGELPFLVPATCEYLGGYFEFEREVPDKIGKKKFKEGFVRDLSGFLTAEQIGLCTQHFGD